MNANEMITENSTIYDIVTRHPELRQVLKDLSPRFERLNNPVMFNTVARITSVAKAAQVGGLYIHDMLYSLNKALGLGAEYIAMVKQSSLKSQAQAIQAGNLPEPDWLKSAREFELFDAIKRKEEPFGPVTQMAAQLENGQGLVLRQAFQPLPLIGYLESLGFASYTEKKSDTEYLVYFYRKTGGPK